MGHLKQTGVELRLPSGVLGPVVGDRPDEVLIECEVFADLISDEENVQRIGGTTSGVFPVSTVEDPTSALLNIAEDARHNLGNLLGDLRISGHDITRFEFYAAPFTVELQDDLRRRLSGSWNERPPS